MTFRFSPKESFAPRKYDALFRHYHCDILLNQAADLLERAIRTRNECAALIEKRFVTKQDIDLFDELDSIRVNCEEPAGYYNIRHNATAAEIDSLNATITSLRSAIEVIDRVLMFGYFNGIDKDRAEASGLAAELSMKPTGHAWTVGAPFGPTHAPDDPDLPNYVPWSSATAELGPAMHQITGWLEKRSLSDQRGTFVAQVCQLQAQFEAAQIRLHNLSVQNNYDSQDPDFASKRDSVQRNNNDAKRTAFKTQGGDLFFDDRIETLTASWQDDVGEVAARFTAIKDGLLLLYGYGPGAAFISDVPPDPGPNSLSATLKWVRDAINFLIAFNEVEQNYVLPISVRASCSNSEWQECLAGRPCSFNIPLTLFGNESHVRLRGLSAYVVQESPITMWNALITPPKQSFIRHLGVPDNPVRLNQADLASCRLGRIQRRDAVRDADIVGLQSLYNASPAGDWTVEVNPFASPPAAASAVEDFHIDLHLAVVRQDPAST